MAASSAFQHRTFNTGLGKLPDRSGAFGTQTTAQQRENQRLEKERAQAERERLEREGQDAMGQLTEEQKDEINEAVRPLRTRGFCNLY